MNEFHNPVAREAFNRAHIFDTTTDQLSGLGMIVEGEWQVLDMVVQAVAQIIADMGSNPLAQITLCLG
jgi:6,7-dimethyl-8-ribityllumazine synthase